MAMEDLLKKIHALHVTNKEIIARVEALEEVLYYSYHARPTKDGAEFVLEEIITNVKGRYCLRRLWSNAVSTQWQLSERSSNLWVSSGRTYGTSSTTSRTGGVELGKILHVSTTSFVGSS